MHYYNEHDKNAAAWIRELIAQGLVPAGEVDERSIVDVTPNDLKRFTQCHFFAGILGWPRALRLAGWGDAKIWTGSCPCQPFSTAGQGAGTADERHLWPAFKWLIDQCRPPVVFGEQVASKLGREWLAGVRADLEGMAYEVGAADLCAAGVGAPHIRQRLYWVAYGPSQRRNGGQSSSGPNGRTIAEAGGGLGDTRCQRDEFGRRTGDVGRTAGEEQSEAQKRQRGGDANSDAGADGVDFWGDPVGLVLPDSSGWKPRQFAATPAGHGGAAESTSGPVGMAHHHHQGSQRRGRPELRERAEQLPAGSGGASDSGLGHPESERPEVRAHIHGKMRGQGSTQRCEFSHWSDYQLVPCRDGKARRIESGSQPLVDGLPRGVVHSGTPSVQEAQATGEARVARLKGYGNAICPTLAAEFILAAQEASNDLTP